MVDNLELARFAYMTYLQRWKYCLGAFGNVATPNFINNRCNQYAWNYKQKVKGLIYAGSHIVCDCYGIQKACNWGNDKGQGRYAVNGQPDYNVYADFYAAGTKRGELATIPRVIGTAVVLMETGGDCTHIGFVVDCSAADYREWLVVDCNGATMGSRLAKIKDVGYWTHWSQSQFIRWRDTSTRSVLNGTNTAANNSASMPTPSTPKRWSLNELAKYPCEIIASDANSVTVKFNIAGKSVGDLVSIKAGAKWINGVNVPDWVLQRQYKIAAVKDSRYLLEGVNSWIDGSYCI